MVLWVLIGLALVKVPIAALMLWLPFRTDERLIEPESSEGDSDGSGGGGGPTRRRPPSPRPRRGPHGLPPQSPPRVRRPGTRRAPTLVSARCATSERAVTPGTRA
jgi:hypothetical protein